jgi:PAS domain S-box-containing protein
MNDLNQSATGDFWNHTEFVLQLLLDSTPSLVEIRTASGIIKLINRAGTDLLQKNPTEIIGKRDQEVYPPELLTFIQFTDQLILRGGYSRKFEETFELFGESYFFEFTKIPLRDSSNQLSGFLTIANDLTNQKKAEDELAEVTQLLQTFLKKPKSNQITSPR